MAGGKPPFARLADINKMLEAAGYPKTKDEPTIEKRLALALADAKTGRGW